MKKAEIEIKDVYKYIYFIASITRRQNKSMIGALSSRGDLIGGIFDRWINTVPESVVFNKIILPEITDKPVEIISDYYLYDPKKAGIAPDVIGLKLNDKITPLACFDNKWTPVKDMPQIEIKTFKKSQKMISLRDQGYDGKFLVMVESDFKIDYLLSFFDDKIFNSTIYHNLKMNDEKFIIANDENLIHGIEEIDCHSSEIGCIELLKITNATLFKKYANLCDKYISPKYIKNIEKKENVRQANIHIPLKDYCNNFEENIYSLNDKWYSNENKEIKTLNIYVENIDNITVIKRNKNNIYIDVKDKCCINEDELNKGYYNISFDVLDRSSNGGQEYFMNKGLVNKIPDKEKELKDKLKDIINNMC